MEAKKGDGISPPPTQRTYDAVQRHPLTGRTAAGCPPKRGDPEFWKEVSTTSGTQERRQGETAFGKHMKDQEDEKRMHSFSCNRTAHPPPLLTTPPTCTSGAVSADRGEFREQVVNKTHF